MRRTLFRYCIFFFVGVFVAGCTDPLTKQNILTTLFDGVPDMPPVERLCEEEMGEKYKEYYDALAVEVLEGEAGKSKGPNARLSRHLPFVEKRCRDCHNFQSANRLITEKNELCFVCHKDFIEGKYVHGPVAVGDCLACHLPHDSKHTDLLQEHRNDICAKCHREGRLAVHMHEQVITHKMNCVDCHDPHSSTAPYFLR